MRKLSFRKAVWVDWFCCWKFFWQGCFSPSSSGEDDERVLQLLKQVRFLGIQGTEKRPEQGGDCPFRVQR